MLLFSAGKREPKVKFGFPHQSFRTGFSSSNRSLRDRNRSPSMQEMARGNLRFAESAQHYQDHPPNFYLQRKSAPNIHSYNNNSFNPLTYQKRHSFQEGIPYSHDQVNINNKYHCCAVLHNAIFLGQLWRRFFLEQCRQLCPHA